MAEDTLPTAATYVYALYREDGITPFYIGIGTNRRWLIHERDAHKGNSRKDRIIMKMRNAGFIDIPKRKLAEGLTRADAALMEIELIAQFGRAPNGPLVNHTSGDGAKELSKEAKIKKSERNKKSWQNPEVRKKRIDGIQSIWTEQRKQEHSIVAIERSKNPEYLSKLRASINLPEIKAKISKGLKENWAKPEIRAKRLKAFEAANQSLEVKKRRSDAGKGRRHSEETKIKIRTIGNSLESRAQKSQRMKEKWALPEWRELYARKIHESHLSEEFRAKISKTQQGRTHTLETRAKIRESAIGRKTSLETRKKLSDIRKAICLQKKLIRTAIRE
jgi:hypothetical protein